MCEFTDKLFSAKGVAVQKIMKHRAKHWLEAGVETRQDYYQNALIALWEKEDRARIALWEQTPAYITQFAYGYGQSRYYWRAKRGTEAKRNISYEFLQEARPIHPDFIRHTHLHPHDMPIERTDLRLDIAAATHDLDIDIHDPSTLTDEQKAILRQRLAAYAPSGCGA